MHHDPAFRERCFDELGVPETELFRDPEFWLKIKEDILPHVSREKEVNIWFPNSVNGFELYSFLLLILQHGNFEKFKMYLGSISAHGLSQIARGFYAERSYHVSLENMARVGIRNAFNKNGMGKDEFMAAFHPGLRKVHFYRQDLFGKPLPSPMMNMIFYRNKFLSFNPEEHSVILSILCSKLKTGGMLFLGYRENIATMNQYHLQLLDPEERIFERKTTKIT